MGIPAYYDGDPGGADSISDYDESASFGPGTDTYAVILVVVILVINRKI